MRSVPAAADPTEHKADWVELEALRSPDKQTSLANFAKAIRRTGSTDALPGGRVDSGSEVSQSIAEEAFAEIDNRRHACGPDRYPFEVERGLVRLKPDPQNSPYILLLLMSINTPTAGHNGTAALFEKLCVRATFGYLGGADNGVEALRFGSPRKAPLAHLHQAIDDLCVKLAEGEGCKTPSKARHTGDEGLDIVAWRNFPDRKGGKLIAFGQCAAGGMDWENKLAELDARNWARKWLKSALIVEPIRLFFVPRRIPSGDWDNAGIDGGILFDRCRIVACLSGNDNTLARECATRTQALIGRLQK
jgi:hypothetical protein